MASKSDSKTPKRVIRSAVLFHNANKPDAVAALDTVGSELEKRGVDVSIGEEAADPESVKGRDLAIALGGDGTMLHYSRHVAPHGVTLLGVNLGGLGFMTAVDLDGFLERIDSILAGEFRVEPRWMLSVEVRRGEEVIFGPHQALNDCVIRAISQARAVTIDVDCGVDSVSSYFGDGIVFATPTGSTAYALAVGGPVMMPDVDAFLLAPVSPHQLTARPLIVAADKPLTAELKRRNPYDQPSALVSVDGQIDHALELDEQVYLRRSAKPLNLLLPSERTHFDLLHEKLKWGVR
jgi:NAD+ kinase